MKARLLVLCLVLIGLVMLASGCVKKETTQVTPTTEKETAGATLLTSGLQTAKQALAIAQKNVPASDAYPYALSTGAALWRAKSDGTCESWTIDFYSPSQSKEWTITIRMGKMTSKSEWPGSSGGRTGLPDGWMDSSAVAKLDIVKSKCSGASQDEYAYILTHDGWQVGCSKPEGDVRFLVDAVTGEFIR